MKKFLNEPKHFVDEMLEGILLAHPDQLDFTAGDRRCIVRAGAPTKGKVGIATGGGSGHLPLFLGYVGAGMLDGCSVGGVFQSPSAEQMHNVTKAISGGAALAVLSPASAFACGMSRKRRVSPLSPSPRFALPILQPYCSTARNGEQPIHARCPGSIHRAPPPSTPRARS